MLIVRRAPASAHLRPVVSSFTERKGHFREMSRMRPLPARPEQILEIYLAECYRVKRTDAGFGLSPDAAVVGPMTEPRVELGFVGEIETFTIHFRPTGLSRLFGVPMDTLANDAGAVSDVLGELGRRLVDNVRRAPSFAQRVEIAEAWTRQLLADARAANAVDHVASLLAAEHGHHDVRALARRADLSSRQLQRRFVDQVGVAPKLYARLCRIAGVIQARNAAPSRTMTDLAYDFGYADQAHLTREFRTLSGRNPVDFFRAAAAVPETETSPGVRFVQARQLARR
jgi:AraC-like DNA-binding protein